MPLPNAFAQNVCGKPDNRILPDSRSVECVSKCSSIFTGFSWGAGSVVHLNTFSFFTQFHSHDPLPSAQAARALRFLVGSTIQLWTVDGHTSMQLCLGVAKVQSKVTWVSSY